MAFWRIVAIVLLSQFPWLINAIEILILAWRGRVVGLCYLYGVRLVSYWGAVVCVAFTNAELASPPPPADLLQQLIPRVIASDRRGPNLAFRWM
jgi:hypothetical protein